MCLKRNFLVICLCAYAAFQFYQVFSSIKYAFFDYQSRHSIKYLVVAHAAIFTVSSFLLIFGSIKSSIKCLLGSLCMLVYKLAFNLWYVKEAFDITIGCDHAACDPNRLLIFYQHFFINRKWQSKQLLLSEFLISFSLPNSASNRYNYSSSNIYLHASKNRKAEGLHFRAQRFPTLSAIRRIENRRINNKMFSMKVNLVLEITLKFSLSEKSVNRRLGTFSLNMK